MAYPYDQIFAADPSDASRVATNGVVTIFEPGDTAQVPLTITTLDGLPLSNPIQVNDAGYGPAFMHATLDQVAWAGGGLSGLFASYKGMKDEAVAARGAAEASRAAAEEAVRNATAPTREAVQQALTTAGPAKDALEASIRSATDPVAAKLASIGSATDPLAYLNSIDILCSWDTRPAGSEATYPQAISINEAAGEIYVSNQGGALLRIDVRNMDGTKKSSRSIVTDNGAYTQALPWFYNDAGDLCFMIRPGVGADPTTGVFSYAIYNYTKGTLGPRTSTGVRGHNLADVQGDKYVTAEGSNFDIQNFFIFDWGSIKAGTPRLLATIPVPGNKVSAAKNQGLAVNGGYIFLLQGAAGANPTISVYDMAGKLVTVHDYSGPDFARALNAVRPGTVANVNSYTYENEGGCSYRGKLATLEVTNNTANMVDSRTHVVIHNVMGGATIPIGLNTVAQHDTGWVEQALDAPFVEWSAASKPAVRRVGSTCLFQGGVKGLATAPASSVVLTVATEFRPRIDRQFSQMSSAGTQANWQLGSNGQLKLLNTNGTSVGAGTWYPLPTMPWFND